MKISKDQVVDFLEKHYIAFIATVSEDEKPHGATIYYAVDNQLTFYFLTKSETFKYKNLQKNPNLTFVVTDEKTLKTIQANGIAEEIKNKSELSRAMFLIAELHHNYSLRWSAPIYKIKKGNYRFIKFTPQWIRLLNFSGWSNIVEYENLTISYEEN